MEYYVRSGHTGNSSPKPNLQQLRNANLVITDFGVFKFHVELSDQDVHNSISQHNDDDRKNTFPRHCQKRKKLWAWNQKSKNETSYTYSALEYSQLCTSASNSHDMFNCWGQSTKKRIKHSNLNVNDNRERWLLVYQSFVIWDSNKLYIIRINKKNNGRTLAHNPKNTNARLWMFPHWRQRITRKRIGFYSRVTHGPKK